MAHDQNAEHNNNNRDGDEDKDKERRSQEGDGGDQGRGRQPGTRGTGPMRLGRRTRLCASPAFCVGDFFLFFCS